MYKEIAVAVATAVLEDLVGNFFSKRRGWCRDQKTWEAVRQVRIVRSWTDYILGSDNQIFQNVAVQDLRHNSDHFMVMGCFHGAPPREHSCYLGRRTCLPIRPPVCQTRTWADNLFSELRRAISKPDKWMARHNSWISVETWRLVNERVSTRREPGWDQRRL